MGIFSTGQNEELAQQISIFQERIGEQQERLDSLQPSLFGDTPHEIAAARLDVEKELATLEIALSEALEKQGEQAAEQEATAQHYSIFD